MKIRCLNVSRKLVQNSNRGPSPSSPKFKVLSDFDEISYEALLLNTIITVAPQLTAVTLLLLDISRTIVTTVYNLAL